MLDTTLPTCEATVQPELVRLMRAALASTEAEVAPPVADTTAQIAPPPKAARQGADGGAPSLGKDPIWEAVALRRDGLRPKRFDGLLIADMDCTVSLPNGAQVHQVVRLYVTKAGAIIAQVACTPDEELGVRPIYSTQTVLCQQDLSRLMSQVSPRTCLGFAAQGHPTHPPFNCSCSANPPGLAEPSEPKFKEH